MPVRRRSLRELGATTHACGLTVERRNYRLQDIQLSELQRFGVSARLTAGADSRRSLQIVWDDLRSSRADIWRAASEEPQATKIQPAGA